MKRYWSIGLCICMLLGITACGSVDAGERSSFQAVVLETAESYVLVEPMEGEAERSSSDKIRVDLGDLEEVPVLSEGHTVRIEYDGQIAESYPAQLGTVYSVQVTGSYPAQLGTVPTTDPSGAEETEENTAKCEYGEASEVAEYGYEDLRMSVSLPEGWDSEIRTVEMMAKEDGLVLFGIDFWKQENPDVKLELGYWPEGIGMCGTGVTIETVSFANGLSATEYTETIQGEVWLTIIYELEMEQGAFVVQADMPEKLWTEYKDEITGILDTVCLEY